MNLSLEGEAQLAQFIAETFFIDRFHQAGAGIPVDFNRSANNLFSQLT